MAYDAGLVARVADALARLGVWGVRQRNVFGGRGFLLRSRAFVIVWDGDILVKLPPDDATRALGEPGVTAFRPRAEAASRTWVVVTADAIAEEPDLVAWLRRSLGLSGGPGWGIAGGGS